MLISFSSWWQEFFCIVKEGSFTLSLASYALTFKQLECRICVCHLQLEISPIGIHEIFLSSLCVLSLYTLSSSFVTYVRKLISHRFFANNSLYFGDFILRFVKHGFGTLTPCLSGRMTQVKE